MKTASIRLVDNQLFLRLLKQPKASPRHRSHFCFHRYEEPLQRVVQGLQPESYVPPHKHQRPDKVEVFICLKGKAAVFQFDDQGRVTKKVVISPQGPVYATDIPPRVWHTLVCLQPNTIIYEAIQGPYNPKTHKKLAPWAPKEGDPQAPAYLAKLKKLVLS